MGENIRVLSINYDSDPYGGVPVFLINVFRHIDHERIYVSFLTADESSFLPYEQEIKEGKGEIYAFHIDINSPYGKLKFGRKLYSFLKDNIFDIVHINSGTVSLDCISAIIAKSCGAKVIVHSHSASKRNIWKVPVAGLMKVLIQSKSDVLCACSKEAALHTFTSSAVNSGKVQIITNGIDTGKFCYNYKIREKTRRDLNIDNCFVVGHVGRFVPVKNQDFLIDVFNEIYNEQPTARLLLVGHGELEAKLKEKINRLNIQDKVIFVDPQNNIEDLYQAMDVFILPSLSEGLPLVVLEAQISGLPCCISDTISKEVDITKLVYRVPLTSSVYEWAKTALLSKLESGERCSHEQEMITAGYGIETTVKQVTQIYEYLA